MPSTHEKPPDKLTTAPSESSPTKGQVILFVLSFLHLLGTCTLVSGSISLCQVLYSAWSTQLHVHYYVLDLTSLS